MALKRTPRPRDPVQLGKLMVDIMTGQVPDTEEDRKNPAAAELGRKGGQARAQALAPERRAEIAREAGRSRRKRPPSEDTDLLS
jgi:general stress protein YciG